MRDCGHREGRSWPRSFSESSGISKDGCFLLSSTQWPVVIREVGNGQHTLVGLAYVYGIMEAEAVEQHVNSGNADKTVKII